MPNQLSTSENQRLKNEILDLQETLGTLLFLIEKDTAHRISHYEFELQNHVNRIMKAVHGKPPLSETEL